VKPLFFFLISLVIVVADQITKWSVIENLPLGASRPAVGNFLYLTHTRNTGGAFSLFPAGNSTFVVVALIAVGALTFAYFRYQQSNVMVSSALGLALGGAVGNLIDRMRFGYVVDFFDLHAGTNHTVWPIFNIADSAITVGIFLLAGHFLFAKDAPSAKQSPATPEHPEAAGTATHASAVSNQSPQGD
jgi:signal peptidase II